MSDNELILKALSSILEKLTTIQNNQANASQSNINQTELHNSLAALKDELLELIPNQLVDLNNQSHYDEIIKQTSKAFDELLTIHNESTLNLLNENIEKEVEIISKHRVFTKMFEHNLTHYRVGLQDIKDKLSEIDGSLESSINQAKDFLYTVTEYAKLFWFTFGISLGITMMVVIHTISSWVTGK